MPGDLNTRADFSRSFWKRLTARPVLAFFFIALLVYNLNLRPISSGDTAPAALLPFTILLDNTITFDSYVPWLQQRYGGAAYFLYESGGHFYSKYPILQPVLLTPLYTPLLLFPNIRHWSPEKTVLLARGLEKIAASLVAACSVAFFFVLASRLVNRRSAALLTVIYAFATSTWSTSSQALWQHGMSELMIILSLLCLDRFLDDGAGLAACAGAGLFAALSVAMRPTNILFLTVSFAVVLFVTHHRRLLASYAFFGCLTGSAIAAYNLRVFGNLRGGYSQPLDGDFWSGFLGLLFSPACGLFFFSPVLLFVSVALFAWLHSGAVWKRSLYAVCLLFPAAHVLLYSKWPVWWAGDSYGTRFMTDVAPCLTILLIPGFALLRRSKPMQTAFAALVAYSIFVQFVGAFSYPRGDWNNTPVHASEHPDRFWAWADNPIRRAIGNGVNLKGYRFVLQTARSAITGKPVNSGSQNFHIQ